MSNAINYGAGGFNSVPTGLDPKNTKPTDAVGGQIWGAGQALNPQFGEGGFNGANDAANAYAQQGASYQSGTAPSIWTPGLAQSRIDSLLSQDSEMAALNKLGQQASGQGPNYAAQATAPGLAQAQMANEALARSAGAGARGALARRVTAGNNAQLATQTGNANAQLAAQAQQRAQSAYASGLNQMMGQTSEQQALEQQGLDQQAQLNQEQQNLADVGQEGYTGLAQQTEAGQLAADASAETSEMNAAQQGQVANANAAAATNQAGMSAGMAAGTAAIMMMSDIRMKSGVRPAGATLGGLMGGGGSGWQDQMRGPAGAPAPAMAPRPMIGQAVPVGGMMRAPQAPAMQVPPQQGAMQSQMRPQPRPMAPGVPARAPMNAQQIGQILSDERAKNVRPGGETEADRFLSTMHPFSYSYKDPSLEPTDAPTGGRYLGVMAQNLERGPTGDTIVRDTPRGKALEGRALMSAMAAGEGRLHERVTALEAEAAKHRRKVA